MNSLSNENDKHGYYFDESEERYFHSPDLGEILLILNLLCNDPDLRKVEVLFLSRKPRLSYIEMLLDKTLAGGIQCLRSMKKDMLNKR